MRGQHTEMPPPDPLAGSPSSMLPETHDASPQVPFGVYQVSPTRSAVWTRRYYTRTMGFGTQWSWGHTGSHIGAYAWFLICDLESGWAKESQGFALRRRQ